MTPLLAFAFSEWENFDDMFAAMSAEERSFGELAELRSNTLCSSASDEAALAADD